MATILDFGFLTNYKPIIIFLLLLPITYAVLYKIGILGQSKSIYWITSFILSLIFVMNPWTTEIVYELFPWFIVLTLVITLFLLAFGIFGAKEDHFLGVIKSSPALQWSIIIIAGCVMLLVISNVIGGRVLQMQQNDTSQYGSDFSARSTNTGDTMTNIVKTIFHPNVLGLFFILVIGAVMIRLLASNT